MYMEEEGARPRGTSAKKDLVGLKKVKNFRNEIPTSKARCSGLWGYLADSSQDEWWR